MNLTYMIMLPMAVSLAALGGPATANDGRAAATGLSTSYGQSLLGAAHLRHPEIAYAQMVVTTAEGAPIKIERRWGFEPSREQKHELVDAIGNDIGTLTLGLRCQKLTNVDAVAGELSRRIYSAASLLESDPFVAGATRAPAAQAMIDEALRHDPSIITLAFHVMPPGQSINSIVASSFGRIGKPADSDDAAVMQQGKPRREITNSGRRIAIELPLLDSHRHIIGALSTSFKLEGGNSADEIESKAIALRDRLARRTPSREALFRAVTASRQVGAVGVCR